MRYLRMISACMLLLVALAACQPGSPTTLVPNVIESKTEAQQLNPEITEMSSASPPAKKFVSLSIKDLGSRLQIDANSISLVKTEAVIWPNAALGCPRPGKFYSQGRVPGYRVWLNAEGREYLYHTDYTGEVILCPELNPDVPNSITGPTPGVPID